MQQLSETTTGYVLD